MKEVWKFGLLDVSTFFLDMPEDAEVLHLAMQDGIPTLWASVDPTSRKRQHKLHCVYCLRAIRYRRGQAVSISARFRRARWCFTTFSVFMLATNSSRAKFHILVSW